MAYKTFLSGYIEYPYALLQRIRDKKVSRDDFMELLSNYSDVFNKIQSADSHLITLTAENQRLRHENEFMLKLINEAMNHEDKTT